MEHAQGRGDGTNKSNVPKRHACAEILRIGMKHDEPMMQNAMPARCVNPPSCDRWPPGGKAIQTHPTESQTTPHPTSSPPRAYETRIENRQPHFLLHAIKHCMNIISFLVCSSTPQQRNKMVCILPSNIQNA